MRDDSQESEGAGSCTQLRGVVDRLEDAVGIHVFDLPHEVADGLASDSSTMAEGRVGATSGDSKQCMSSP